MGQNELLARNPGLSQVQGGLLCSLCEMYKIMMYSARVGKCT